MEKEYQHIIPQGYLKAWCTPDPPPWHAGQIWVIQKVNPTSRALTSPKKHFARDDRYTVTTGGARDLSVENALGKVEKAFGDVMARIKQNQPLRPKDRVYLSFFAAAMLARVEPFTDVVGGMLETVLAQARRMEEHHGASNKLSTEMAGALVNNVGDTVSIATVEDQKVLERMSLAILTIDDEFITSDSPGHLCVPALPPVVPIPLLRNKDVEFTLPLSPHHLAVYTWPGAQVRYEIATRRQVDEANSRRISGCVKELVSRKGVIRPEWLAPDPA